MPPHRQGRHLGDSEGNFIATKQFEKALLDKASELLRQQVVRS